jgi:transcriptional regulator with XRE-family HTH domain
MSDAPRFNADKMQEDMALRGWLKTDLAARAGVSDMTVARFLRGDHRTSRTAKKLAKALGYSIRRYLVTRRAA